MARPHRRNPPRRQYGQRLLVVCEGNDERGYLCDARRAFGLSRSGVVITANHGGSPEDIVKAAVAERDRYAMDRGEARFDAVWAVLDAEDAATSRIAAALRTAQSEALRVALSNPCFEVWLLLHHSPQGAPMTSRDAKRRCSDSFGIPKRNGRRPTFEDERLGSDWQVAARHARLGRGRLVGHGQPDSSSELRVLARNPSSNIDELLTAMLHSRAGRLLR